MQLRFALCPGALACLGMLAACDQTTDPPAAGRYTSALVPVRFDVPFAGVACGRTYTDARRQTTGRISAFELTITETARGLAETASVDYGHATVIRQAGSPECDLGGLLSGGIDSVAVAWQGAHLITDRLAFAERGEFDVTEGGLSGVLVVGDTDAEYGFGAVPDVPVTLRRVPARSRP